MAERRTAQEREAKLEEVRTQVDALQRAYWELSLTPQGKQVLEDLNTMFGERTTIRKVGPHGEQRVDPYASIAAAGGNEVIMYINACVRSGSPGAFGTVQPDKEAARG